MSSIQLVSVRWWNASAYYAVTLAEILQSRGLKTVVGGSADSPPLEQAGRNNLPVAAFQFESFNPWHFFRNLRLLKMALVDNQIDIMNVHRPEDHFYSIFFRNNSSGRPLIRTVGDVRSPKVNYLNKIIHLHHTDFFIFSCHANRKRYQNIWPIPENKTEVIYAGVDTQHFSPTERTDQELRKLGIPPGCITFGMVGRLSPVKNHSMFLQAASQLLKEQRNAFFIISGEEVEIKEADLKQLSQQLGIADQVLIAGKFEDVREIIRLIDVGVVCSRDSEAISRITAEFMSMSKPVIVTDINVLPEMVAVGHNGFVTKTDSAELLYQKMKKIMENPELRRKMGKNARSTAVRRFSYNRFFEDTVRVYEKVLNTYRSGIHSTHE
ncbi:MAG: glycosyltransferase family 4 protein [Calditrichaeota bacterium]|nr:glycosyltransferase family 4 protein [Calditrichota bacterium]